MGHGMEDGSGPVLVGTKLRPPPVRDQVVPRERLVERMRPGSGLRLTLVACPPGFGKTTMLAAWHQVEAARRPVAWLTPDEGDNDPAVLWSYVIEALGRACPAIGQPVPLRTAGVASISGVSPARPAGGLRNRRRWHRRAGNGQLARRRWPTARSSRARRAVWKNSGCWPAGNGTRPGARHREGQRRGPAGARGIARRARKARAGTAADRVWCRLLAFPGPAAEVAMALLHQGSVLQALGNRERSQAAMTEARSHHRILSRSGHPHRAAECAPAVPAGRHQLRG